MSSLNLRHLVCIASLAVALVALSVTSVAVADDAERERIFLTFEGDEASTLEREALKFQGPVAGADVFEFAGTSEMEVLYAACGEDIGVNATTRRDCQLRAANRIMVTQVLQLSGDQVDKKTWDVALEVWSPETNGLLWGDTVEVEARSLRRAAREALPELADRYLCWRGVASACTGEDGEAVDTASATATAPEKLTSCQDSVDEAACESRACDGGDLSACVRAGEFDARGLGVAIDLERARERFGKACDGGDLDGCVHLAQMDHVGPGFDRDHDNARALYARACDKGHAEGCLGLAKMHAWGAGMDKDKAKAAEIATKACDADLAEACDYAARWSKKKSSERSELYARARELYTRGCDAGDAGACGGLAEFYSWGGAGLSKDEDKAHQLYTAACDEGDAQSCYQVAFGYHNGRGGVAEDPHKAGELYARACDLGDTQGCNQAGQVYAWGEAQDPALAVRYFEKACVFGHDSACSNLGNNYLSGEGVDVDPGRARELYTLACEHSQRGTGCSNLAFMYERGEHVHRDLDKAVELHERACERGGGPPCHELAGYYERGEVVTRDTDKAQALFEKACENRYWGSGGARQEACDKAETLGK